MDWTQPYFTLQDAHEFLNFLLNELVDILEKEHNAAKESLQNISLQKNSNGPINGQPNGSHKELAATWVHKCFQVRFLSFVPTGFCVHAYGMCINSRLCFLFSLGDEPIILDFASVGNIN
jgi:hypothetical protein